jgi:antitoxin (DNA-binding transcriptional repressor) of toxin-antitoxin stability system
MLTKTVDVQEAQTNLKELLFLALKGIEVVLTDGGIPLVRLAPIIASPPKQRTAGLHAGAIWTSDDFDEPLPDELKLSI